MHMKVVTPTSETTIDYTGSRKKPESMETCSVFLAGTIDNGSSYDWQSEVINGLSKHYLPRLTVFNPRRSDWNKDATEEDIIAQIEWEQEQLENVTYIFMVFIDDSKSPISFLELGEFKDSDKIVVFCSPKFYRYTNIKMFCKSFDIPLVEDTSVETIVQSIVDEIDDTPFWT